LSIDLKKSAMNNFRTCVRFASSTIALQLAVLVAFVLNSGLGLAQSSLPEKSASPLSVRYTNVAKAAGLDFKQDATATDQKYYLETMGTGLGWIDYDNDGLMDLYFVQSAATDIYKPPQPLHSALFRNNGDGTFREVTSKAGVGAEGLYGQGVAVGDFDNDGYPDLYVTGYGRSILYHNNGNGTFTDVTEKAGVGDKGGWATSAGWLTTTRTAILTWWF
jgi:enediyne biosynthesis protein E4